ncbi:WAT1-related protein At5g47470-like isoform X2 [Vigna umbellata]|uniref:WAT1-related protein At5g47470-like isoform X2 n=1 Tax=Vigna umbellata TaxID=87088 RepID=UPI001F5F0F97|nr:WAT1-related protein At5g47470-like isoform X2 [Vigna umbellata]
MSRGTIEDVAIIGGLVGVQFIYAGNAVFMGYALSLGFSSLTIIILTSLATFLVLFPVSFFFERSKWPKNCDFKLIKQLLCLSFGGLLFQYLFLKGLDLTSPAMGTAMPNIAPGLIFIIAWISGLEKVNLNNQYSKVKIMGTLLCVLGALTMSIMQSISTGAPEQKTPSGFVFNTQKMIGCFYLVVAVVILSSNVVLQAFTLGDFPAPMSLGAITSLLSAFMTATVQVLEKHRLKTGRLLLRSGNLIGYFIMAGAVSGICLSFNGWALKKKGPVFVSMFSPIGTVCSVIFAVIKLGESMSAGSLGGMFLMFTGLYLVLWAKGEEGLPNGDSLESEFDIERPLLC